MKSYAMFFILAATTVSSPGPGVLLTLTNAMQHGVLRALPGIVGIAMGAAATAAVSASGVGLIVASSPHMLAVLKYLGAAYLAYLGLKLLRSRPTAGAAAAIQPGLAASNLNTLSSWWSGMSLQFTNPKSLLFFMSVLPQFAGTGIDYPQQVTLLIMTYCLLVVAIHGVYAVIARQAKDFFKSSRTELAMKRLSGACFILFSATLLTAQI